MNILLVNGSPKEENSNSGYLLSELKKTLGESNTVHECRIQRPSEYQTELETVSAGDTLVFAFPLYVDGIPSHLLYFLEEIRKFLKSKNNKAIRVYAMVNCGFYEGRQCRLALQIMENWCAKSGLVWAQGIGFGAGEMLGGLKSVPMGCGPKKSPGKAINNLAGHIINRTGAENIFVSADFPRFAYILAAHMGWRSQAKANGLKIKELRKKR